MRPEFNMIPSKAMQEAVIRHPSAGMICGFIILIGTCQGNDIVIVNEGEPTLLKPGQLTSKRNAGKIHI